MKKFTSVLLVLLFFVGCSHPGKKMHQSKMKMFEKMDANGDKEVTEEEFMNGHKKMFEKMDANKDGKVTADEKMNFHKSKKSCSGH